MGNYWVLKYTQLSGHALSEKVACIFKAKIKIERFV
jgi:hypothetical protein